MGFADISDIAFPWDLLVPFARIARGCELPFVDLSVGTPVDPTPVGVQAALASASDAHGYPLTWGTEQLRESVARWFARRRGVPNVDPKDVLPTIGSKELVGLLPSLLHLGPSDVVVYPTVAYPTYEVGIRLAGAVPLAADDVSVWRGNTNVKLVWVNSPGNPHGAVLTVAQLKEVVDAAREIGALVVSDECYAELPWSEPFVADGVPSALDPEVVGDDYRNVLVTYSLSKQSNMAGYRAAFVAGDSAVIARLLELRKHLGMIVPAPVQNAMVAALNDDDHVLAQREVYRARREVLLNALTASGLTVDLSHAGLYLWVRALDSAAIEPLLSDESRELVRNARRVMPGKCWEQVALFAQLGVLVAPGAFYGEQAQNHVRIALTANDDEIAAAGQRIQNL